MSLVPRFVYGDLDLTEWPFAIEFGSDFGNPENVVDVVQTLLHDGEVLESTRRTNRTLSLTVLVEEADLLALATAEASLIAEADKQRNTLAVEPGDGIGPTTVFETFRAQPRWVRDDDMEQQGFRRYQLEIPALPHGRSVDLITDDAGTPPSAGGTLLYNCESTTGWAPTGYAPYGSEYVVDASSFTEGAGSLRSRTQNYNNYTPGVSNSSGQDTVSGLSLSTGSGGYLSVAVRFQHAKTALTIHVTTAAGRERVYTPLEMARDAEGFVQYVWPVAAGLTITAIDFAWSQTGPAIASMGSTTNPPHYVWYDNFQLLPAATTDQQILKQLDVKGSARTTGSLRVAAPTDIIALGKVLAVTAPTADLPAGYMPDGRRWVSQGTTTVDATALWGSYYTPSTTIYDSAAGKPIFDVPVGMLTPGPYTIVALVKAEASPTVAGVQAQLRVGSTNVGPTSAAEVSLPNLVAGWQFVVVGTVNLPPLPMQSADVATKVRLLFKGAKLSDVYMIPAWQVAGRPVAEFSIVDCGTGTVGPGAASSNLWIDSPSTSQPRGGWWRGPTSDRLNTQSAWPDAKKPGVHGFAPGGLTAFLVSLGAQGPTLTLEYFPAWFGNSGL